eukprot:TRINITY_DN28199_c0_g1_i1.p1 TRINITY_DN28199_c0_g1~~TRINITY_DN28199_c0_g1_i1.p1  ORF type:complete len:680 (+),score=148.48 TRINITY_DN28199_c0_g1_i1:76-2115(+)
MIATAAGDAPFISRLVSSRRGLAGRIQAWPEGPAAAEAAWQSDASKTVQLYSSVLSEPVHGERFERLSSSVARLSAAALGPAAADGDHAGGHCFRAAAESEGALMEPRMRLEAERLQADLPALLARLGMFAGGPGDVEAQAALKRTLKRIHKAHRRATVRSCFVEAAPRSSSSSSSSRGSGSDAEDVRSMDATAALKGQVAPLVGGLDAKRISGRAKATNQGGSCRDRKRLASSLKKGEVMASDAAVAAAISTHTKIPTKAARRVERSASADRAAGMKEGSSVAGAKPQRAASRPAVRAVDLKVPSAPAAAAAVPALGRADAAVQWSAEDSDALDAPVGFERQEKRAAAEPRRRPRSAGGPPRGTATGLMAASPLPVRQQPPRLRLSSPAAASQGLAAKAKKRGVSVSVPADGRPAAVGSAAVVGGLATVPACLRRLSGGAIPGHGAAAPGHHVARPGRLAPTASAASAKTVLRRPPSRRKARSASSGLQSKASQQQTTSASSAAEVKRTKVRRRVTSAGPLPLPRDDSSSYDLFFAAGGGDRLHAAPALAPGEPVAAPVHSALSGDWIRASAQPPSHLVLQPSLDEATLELERLVEETHQALVRDGLLRTSMASYGSPGPPAYQPMGSPPLDASAFSDIIIRDAVPSLDAVDRALEDLQRGLSEIDGALAASRRKDRS